MKIKIQIETGNEAMQTGADVSRALIKHASAIAADVDSGIAVTGGKIMDVNGNSVGKWEVEN